jgi:hypothetical protein
VSETFERLLPSGTTTWVVPGCGTTASAAGVVIATFEHAASDVAASATGRSRVERKLREIFVIAASWSISSRLRGA